METKYVSVIVGVLVSALVLGAFVPIFSDVTATEDDFENKGIYYMQNPTEPMSVVYSGDTDWVIDGEPLNYTVLGATNIIVLDDNLYVRNVGQVRGSVYTGWSSAELTIGNGTVTGTAIAGGNSTTINWTYTTAYIATNDENADYIMTNPNNNTYIKSDSDLIGLGLSTVKDADGNNQFVTFSVVVDGIDNVSVTTQTDGITITDVVVNCEAVSGYIDLYKFTSVTFNAVWGENTTPLTYNIIIAPSSVTAERSVHGDDAFNSVINIIPLVAGLGLLLGAVYYFISRR